MSSKKTTSTTEKKVRTKAPVIAQEKLQAVDTALKAVIETVGTFEDSKFIDSMNKNLLMAQKKIRAKLNSSKRADILKALREGKEVIVN